MTVRTLRAAPAHCPDCGSFIKAGTPECRRCAQRAADRPNLTLVKAPKVPALSLVKPIPPAPAVTVLAPNGETGEQDAQTAAQRAGTGPVGEEARQVADSAPTLPQRPHIHGLSIAETAAARAAMAARVVGLRVRVMDWRGRHDGTATALTPGGVVLRYQPAAPRPFAASVPCLLGAHHFYQVAGPKDLAYAIADADCCIALHADFTDWATAAAKDLSAAFAPRHVATCTPVRHLADKARPSGGTP